MQVLGIIYENFCYCLLLIIRIIYGKEYEKIFNYPFKDNDEYISNFRRNFYVFVVILSVLPSILYYRKSYIFDEGKRNNDLLLILYFLIMGTTINSIECQIVSLFEELEFSYFLIDKELENCIKCVKKQDIRKLRQEHTNASKNTRNLLRICECDLFLIISRNAIRILLYFNYIVIVFTDQNRKYLKFEKAFTYLCYGIEIINNCTRTVWIAVCSSCLTSQVTNMFLKSNFYFSGCY